METASVFPRANDFENCNLKDSSETPNLSNYKARQLKGNEHFALIRSSKLDSLVTSGVDCGLIPKLNSTDAEVMGAVGPEISGHGEGRGSDGTKQFHIFFIF